MGNNMAKARKVKEANQQLIKKLVTNTNYSKRVIQSAMKIGCSEAQIMSVPNEDALWALVTNVDPKLIAEMPVADIKEASKPAPPEPVPMVSKTTGLNITISPQVALTWKRGDYEQSAFDHYIGRNGIKKQSLVRVVITRKYIPNNTSKYETDFEIHYKEPR